MWQTNTEVRKLFACSTQLSMKFHLLIKGEKKIFLVLKLKNVVFILLINVKMPEIVGILTVMRRIFHAQIR